MDKPTLPKGTRDFGPSVMAKRQFILSAIRQTFQKFGFLPLETPAMENLSVLTGKYGDEGDQLLFRILDSGPATQLLEVFEKVESATRSLNQQVSVGVQSDLENEKAENPTVQKGRKLRDAITEKGLRYDLTVPFARYVVMNSHSIALPFKRYQIQPVWRADRPQKGRYREFYQCDADVVGTYSLLCEAEIILMIREVFQLLNIQDYTIKINHRDILAGLAEMMEAKGKETSLYVAIDNLDKNGEKGGRDELSTHGFNETSVNSFFSLLNAEQDNKGTLSLLTEQFKKNDAGKKGIADLKHVLELLQSYGASEEYVEIDLALARGLSYYTGTIFEVKVNNVAIGSVSGGGRYDNLTQAFGSREPLPGIGISFGVDRLYDVMEELSLFPDDMLITSRILICHFDKKALTYGLQVLSALRRAGISSEIYPDEAKIKKQLDYANKKLIPFALVIGDDEMTTGALTLKDMHTGTQEKITTEDIIKKLSQ